MKLENKRITTGLTCPSCGRHGIRVVDSRRHESYIQRTRECDCGSRCTTAEIILPQRGKKISTQLDTLFMRRALTTVLDKVDELKKSIIEEISVCDGVGQ